MKKNYSSKIKLLIVGSFPDSKIKNIYGGQLTACKALINSEFSRKFNILKINSSTFSNPPPNIIIRSIFASIRMIKFIYKIIFDKPHVILIFVADKFSALEKGSMIIIAKILNKKVMIFPRAGALINQYFKSSIFRNFLNFSFSKSDIFLCQGISFQNFATRNLNFTKEKAPIIPNWTAKKEYLSLGSNRDYFTGETFPKILFLGWLEEYKGINELLAAANILKVKKYKFHISLAGDGSCKKHIKNYIRENKLERYISLIGWIDDSKKIQILEESNIFLLPSWNEGFPNSLIEAMSAGLACIVTKVGMIPDFVENEENCLLISHKKVEEIVMSLEKLFENSQLRQKIANNGHLHANRNFRADNGLELLSNEIKNLIN